MFAMDRGRKITLPKETASDKSILTLFVDDSHHTRVSIREVKTAEVFLRFL